jgi:hypothetical protein
VTSDTLDVRGPIPLTRAGLHVSSVLSLMFILCKLPPVNAWHTPCASSKFSLCSELKAKGCCLIRVESRKYLHAQKIMKILVSSGEF